MAHQFQVGNDNRVIFYNVFKLVLTPQIYKGDPSAPCLSWHVAQIEGLQVFPIIKITMVCQVHMSPASTATEREDKHA